MALPSVEGRGDRIRSMGHLAWRPAVPISDSGENVREAGSRVSAPPLWVPAFTHVGGEGPLATM
jgi:hypothetical protein